MDVFTRYSSALLKSIGKMSRISANYHMFSLDDIIRNRATALGIRRQKMFTPYRRSRGGSTIHRIKTHIAFGTKCDKSSSQHRPTNSGVDSNNLIKINLQQTIPKQIPNIISLNVINAQSICGPNGKTEDFIDHITHSLVDICVVTETFLTEQNSITRAALHLPGFAFQDQPRSNGDARGGIGIFYHDSFHLSKLSHTERRSFELSEWCVSWHNYCMRLCIVYHQPPTLLLMPHSCMNSNHTLMKQCWSRKCYASLGISTYMSMIQMTHMVLSLRIYYQAMVLLTTSLSLHIRLVTLLTWLLHEIFKSWNLDQSDLATTYLITASSVQI